MFNVPLDQVNMYYVLRRTKELATMSFLSKAANGGGLESMLTSGMQYLKVLAKQVSAIQYAIPKRNERGPSCHRPPVCSSVV